MARKKKKRSPVMSILAFVTIVVVTTFIYLRGKRNHIQEVSQFTNTTFSAYQNEFIRDSRRTLLNHSIRKKRLADALWTIKPKIQKTWGIPDDNRYIFDEFRGRLIKEKEKEVFDNDFSQTTPTNIKIASSFVSLGSKTTSVTEAPTTPITTQSVTTPIYTASPTSPITTEPVTTPMVTEPGEIEVTTEMDIDDIDSETLMMIRNRRGVVGGGTTTTPFPLTTSVAPPVCGNGAMDDPNYYEGPTGDCECGLEMTGPSCSDAADNATIQDRIDRSLYYTTEAIGSYDNSTRKDFHRELEQYYSDLPGFVRVYVMPTTYNPETNRTELSYYVIFDEVADAEDASRSASITSEIVGDVLPIEVNNQLVTFGENSTLLLRPREDGTIQSIPIPSQTLPTVCYIYDIIGACTKNGGECRERNGEPYCHCTRFYVGEYCEEAVKIPDDIKDKIMTILMPTLVALAAAAAMCSCCFFCCCRRVNKGDDVSSIYSEESWVEPPKIILPRYYPYAWKQFIAGAEAEEEEGGIYRSVSMQEVAPVIIERPVIQPVIVERVVVQDRYRELEAFAPAVVERPVIQPVVVERVVVQDRPVVPVTMETEAVSDVSTELSCGSVILPRFYPTPFRQLIAGPVGEEQGQVVSGRYKRNGNVVREHGQVIPGRYMMNGNVERGPVREQGQVISGHYVIDGNVEDKDLIEL